MASHHHHHHLNTATTTTTNGCCCCCGSNYSNQCQPLNHPSPSVTDPLLQAFVSHFLLQQQQQNQGGAPCQCQPRKPHEKHHLQQQKKHLQYKQQQEQLEARFVLSSLLSRIDALETSLHKFSSSSTHNRHTFCSLRDAAASLIQTHFRAFLVRRSRTLRQLKELAFIKSRFNSLKLSISKKAHLDFQLVSQKATDLLLKLDSIQGGDPMVRDGKRSISMELVKFLEFVDGFAVRKQRISSKAAKNVKIVGTGSNKTRVFGGSSCHVDLPGEQSEITENLRDRIEKIRGFSRVYQGEDEDVELEWFHQIIDDEEEEEEEENPPRVSRNRNGVLLKRHEVGRVVSQPRVKKSVSFAENGNVIRVFSNDDNREPSSSRDGSLSDGSVSSEDHDGQVEVEAGKVLSKESEEGEEECLENGGSPWSSDGESNHTMRSLRREGGSEIKGQFVFSAPLPVKMESRADLMKKRKPVKISHERSSTS